MIVTFCCGIACSDPCRWLWEPHLFEALPCQRCFFGAHADGCSFSGATYQRWALSEASEASAAASGASRQLCKPARLPASKQGGPQVPGQQLEQLEQPSSGSGAEEGAEARKRKLALRELEASCGLACLQRELAAA